MSWFVEDPARFLRERDALHQLAAEGWLTHRWRSTADGQLAVDLDMTIHGRLYAATMAYPALFPLALPPIRPRDSTELWSIHQYGVGGSLCLEHRADNWTPDLLGADLVRSAHKLLSTEGDPIVPQDVPSAHRVTSGQVLRNQRERWVVTPDALEKIAALPLQSITTCATVTIGHQRAQVRFVSNIGVDETKNTVDDLPRALSEYFPIFTWSGAGLIFRNTAWAGFERLKSVDALIVALNAAGFDTDCLSGLVQADGHATLIVLAGDTLDSSIAYVVTTAIPDVLIKTSIVRSGTSVTRVPEEARRLAQVCIGVVGAGSMGSKIAVSLARSGVRRLVLVDDDVLLGENIVRHELDWLAVGLHKVEGLRDRLHLIAPRMDVTVHQQQVTGQESPLQTSTVLQDLSACDLIIDATANPNVFVMLASVAQAAKKALLWAELFASGFGGLMARARPGADPNPFAMRDALLDYFSRLPLAPHQQAADYDGGDAAPQVAYDADVGFIAASATRLALDTVLGRNPSHFPCSAYLLGLRQEWIFEAPFDTRPLELTGRGWETERAPTTPDQYRQLFEALTAIHQGEANAPYSADA